MVDGERGRLEKVTGMGYGEGYDSGNRIDVFRIN